MVFMAMTSQYTINTKSPLLILFTTFLVLRLVMRAWLAGAIAMSHSTRANLLIFAGAGMS